MIYKLFSSQGSRNGHIHTRSQILDFAITVGKFCHTLTQEANESKLWTESGPFSIGLSMIFNLYHSLSHSFQRAQSLPLFILAHFFPLPLSHTCTQMTVPVSFRASACILNRDLFVLNAVCCLLWLCSFREPFFYFRVFLFLFFSFLMRSRWIGVCWTFFYLLFW